MLHCDIQTQDAFHLVDLLLLHLIAPRAQGLTRNCYERRANCSRDVSRVHPPGRSQSTPKPSLPFPPAPVPFAFFPQGAQRSDLSPALEAIGGRQGRPRDGLAGHYRGGMHSGEMERDCLVDQGCANFSRDRLFISSRTCERGLVVMACLSKMTSEVGGCEGKPDVLQVRIWLLRFIDRRIYVFFGAFSMHVVVLRVDAPAGGVPRKDFESFFFPFVLLGCMADFCS